mmetsp:Transcript_23710/g.25339  ORF Transcript_23710/g.25339 Transcript_23710/m.25339 type:complete len:148 (+) Transcript_23710:765-1208(+)
MERIGDVQRDLIQAISTEKIIQWYTFPIVMRLVDSLNGSINHAATLGARSTVHATTTTANVGFRCAKAPKRRTEYHYVDHDETSNGQLALEDQFGKRDMIPQMGWEDRHWNDDEDEDELDDDTIMNIGVGKKKKRVIKKQERYSNEL